MDGCWRQSGTVHQEKRARVNFSVVILTYNEERNIQACLDSLRCCDEVVVVDSFSTDRTREIAHAAGCKVVEREFDDFAGQRNWAMDSIDFKHKWVFHLDADERFTPELAGECEDVVHEDLFSGYMVASKLMFMGKWLKRSAGFPVYQMRLAKLGEIKFIQHGHGQREADAIRGVGFLRRAYLHFPFKKGMQEWHDKHLCYADDEARLALEEAGVAGVGAGALMAADPVLRRRALKRLSRSLPLRPALRFLYMYILKMGFMDGAAGLRYCRMMAEFERMIDVRLTELKRGSRPEQ